jgi:hypothetical protein
MWAVVADAPLDRFSEEQLQKDLQDLEAVSRHALAHASIVEFFFRRSPVIPLKLFTLFSSDDRAREHLLGRRTRLQKLFAELRGLEEWGVRIIIANMASGVEASAASGRDYLQLKKQLKDRGERPSRAVVKEANAALTALGRLASKMRREAFPPPGPGRPFVTGASFLVKAKRRNQWKKAAAKLAASLEARSHRLEMSGPWPPYHFASR